MALILAGRRLEVRPVLTIFAAVGLAILISLGMWQLDRRAWKLDLIEKIDTRTASAPIAFADAVARAAAGEDMTYTPVFINGTFRRGAFTRVFGSYEKNAGVYVFAPLMTAGGETYVNLGFAPQANDMTERLDALYTDGAEQTVTGLFRVREKLAPPAAWFVPTTQSPDGLWYIRDPVKFAAADARETTPYYIDQAAVETRAWPQGGTTKIEFRNKHMEYALTWFGLAATLVAIWTAFSFRRPSSEIKGP
ncbi:MAG: SURF1 family protein [Pseudomonadota bacterium]